MQHRKFRALALVGMAGLAAGAIHAPVLADVALPGASTLDLATGTVRADALPDLLAGDAAFNELGYVVVLQRAMDADMRAGLDAAGVRVLGHVPERAVLADLRETTTARLRASGLVASVHAWENDWKLSPELTGPRPFFVTPERAALEAQGAVAATVTLFPGAVAANFAAALAQIGGAFLDSELVGDSLVAKVSVPAARVDEIAAIREVLFAEPAPEFTTRSTLTTRWVVTTNQQDNFALYQAGLTGVGQTCGVIDSAPDFNHCAFFDADPFGPEHRKIQAYNISASFFAFHGTHTSSILLGNAIGGDGGPEEPPPGPPSPDLQGVAYGARMVYNTYPAFGEANVYARFELHRTQGAFVHSNSWGNDNTRAYDSTCRAIDNFMWTNQDQLLVYSTSNSSLIRNPENAKNLIGVGSSANAPMQDTICGGGEGPSLDGRIKPDVVAPGCAINAAGANSGCDTAVTGGTSMACPAAAGVATLIRQYFTQGWYPSGAPNTADAIVPSGALLKAMTINSASDVGGWAGHPGTRDGWGRVLADNVLFLANRTPAETRKLAIWDTWNGTERALSTGQSRTFRVNVQNAGEPLEFTLTWTDAPATAGVASPEVNHLNLSVLAPDGTTYRGNVIVDGVSIPGGAFDTENNVEAVMVPVPQVGVWTITVTGAAVNVGTQGFAIVATGGLAPVTCNDVDFNNDGSFFDPVDVDAFLSVFSEGPCIPETQACDPVDFNNDGSLFDPLDIEAFLRVFSEGPCE